MLRKTQMLNGVYQNAAAMTGLEAWNNSIAQNISQASVPGYKKAMVSFQGVERGKLGVADSFGNQLYRAQIQSTGVGSVDFTNGTVRQTNGDFDFALEGPGFFELRAPDGQLVYSRDGQFHANSDGELVSKQGFHVMSDTRNIIQLVPDGGPLEVDSNGVVRQSGQRIGEFSIREPEDSKDLIRSHGGFVLNPNSDNKMMKVDTSFVRHGSLEQSNVEATTEMINLINVSRSFEVNQRVVQQHDDILGKAIQALGGSR